MKNLLKNFNWFQAIGITLIILAFILGCASIVLFMSAKPMSGCICLAIMLICVFVVAGVSG